MSKSLLLICLWALSAGLSALSVDGIFLKPNQEPCAHAEIKFVAPRASGLKPVFCKTDAQGHFVCQLAPGLWAAVIKTFRPYLIQVVANGTASSFELNSLTLRSQY